MVDQSKRTFLKGIVALAALAAFGGLEAIAEAASPAKNSRAINAPVADDFLKANADVTFYYKAILGDDDLKKEAKGDLVKTGYEKGSEVIDEVKPKMLKFSIRKNSPSAKQHNDPVLTAVDKFDERRGELVKSWQWAFDLPKYVVKKDSTLKDVVDSVTAGYITLEEKAQALLCFVQTGIAVEAKDGKNDFVRGPVKTIIDKKGDDKDKAVLYASLLKHLGVEPVFLMYDRHVAVGVPFKFEYMYRKAKSAMFEYEVAKEAVKLPPEMQQLEEKMAKRRLAFQKGLNPEVVEARKCPDTKIESSGKTFYMAEPATHEYVRAIGECDKLNDYGYLRKVLQVK